MLVFPTELYNAWAQQKNRKSADIEIAVICVLLVLVRAAISYCIISDLYEIIASLPLFSVLHVDYKFKLKVCVKDSLITLVLSNIVYMYVLWLLRSGQPIKQLL